MTWFGFRKVTLVAVESDLEEKVVWDQTVVKEVRRVAVRILQNLLQDQHS